MSQGSDSVIQIHARYSSARGGRCARQVDSVARLERSCSSVELLLGPHALGAATTSTLTVDTVGEEHLTVSTTCVPVIAVRVDAAHDGSSLQEFSSRVPTRRSSGSLLLYRRHRHAEDDRLLRLHHFGCVGRREQSRRAPPATPYPALSAPHIRCRLNSPCTSAVPLHMTARPYPPVPVHAHLLHMCLERP